MKKVLSFLRSMSFGLILLCLILCCSLAGSLIEQGMPTEYYLENYSQGELIVSLGLSNIFSSWYFAVIIALLCANLVFCSLLRLKNTCALYDGAIETVIKLPLKAAQPETVKKIEALFLARGMRCTECGQVRVYAKNRLGLFGSYATHLGLLLLLVSGAAVLAFSVKQDLYLLPGESFELSDGTALRLESFRLTDEDGKPDYESRIFVSSPEGRESGALNIAVNCPQSFAGHKYYQQSFDICGRISIDGSSETLLMSAGELLSPDGENGVELVAIFPDYIESGDMLLPLDSGNYERAVYILRVHDGESSCVGSLKAGESLEAAGISCSFLTPAVFSGIRVKTTPAGVMPLLYLSFVILLMGLYMCFFARPVFARTEPEGYALWDVKNDFELRRSIERLGNEEIGE